MSQLQILQILADGDHTMPEIAKLTGLSYTTVLRQCRALWIGQEIHIGAWEKSVDSGSARYARVFSLGNKPDKSKPPAVAHIDASRAYKMRKSNAQSTVRKAKDYGIWAGLL